MNQAVNLFWTIILCLLFFSLTSVHAIIFKQYLLGIFIIIANVLYNVCPLLLQQYNRARVSRVLGTA
jgi:hypothetical protein